ncbi:MAG TPA: hypothetical protein VNI01_08215 [Elusimicrobiota bacterium]|nr:hypothetical protein [Elusimicrobiota bacterium]
MKDIPQTLKDQIEAAYDFRGHVTITLKDGRVVVGFLYNREFANPKLATDHYIDVMVKDSDANERYPMADVAAIALTGTDYAAGNSYEDYLKKKAAGKA